jgi:hypothetical protein
MAMKAGRSTGPKSGTRLTGPSFEPPDRPALNRYPGPNAHAALAIGCGEVRAEFERDS